MFKIIVKYPTLFLVKFSKHSKWKCCDWCDVTIGSRGWWAPVVLARRGNSSATTLLLDFGDLCSWTWNIYMTQIGWVRIFKVERVETWNNSWRRIARNFMATTMLIELLSIEADISAVHVLTPFLTFHISLYFAQCLIYSFHICWWAKFLNGSYELKTKPISNRFCLYHNVGQYIIFLKYGR